MALDALPGVLRLSSLGGCCAQLAARLMDRVVRVCRPRESLLLILEAMDAL